MKIINISETTPIVSHYMCQLRNVETQKNRQNFGDNVRNLGRLLSIEASKYIDYEIRHITTPFGETYMNVIEDFPVLFAIIRAGIKLQEGVSDILASSQMGFCTCPKNKDGGRDVHLFAPCDTTGKIVIISDPIMTTASSMIHTINAIKRNGQPKTIIILNLISTELAVKTLSENGLASCILITCSIDGFTKGIRGTLPGLGDAGDLIYS